MAAILTACTEEAEREKSAFQVGAELTLRLEAACARALSYDNPRYRTVKEILERGLDAQLDLLPSHARILSAAYTGQGRFCRDTRTLFN